MKLRTEALVTFLLILINLSVSAQTVTNPIGSNYALNSVSTWGDNLILTGRSDVFGTPLSGFDIIDSSTGKLISYKHDIQGATYSSLMLNDSSFFLSGRDFSVNGVRTSSHLVLVNPNGVIDTSLHVVTEFMDKSSSPDRLIPGTIGTIIKLGDTLIVSGTFSRINKHVRMNVAAIDLRTNTVLDWSPKLGYSNGVRVKRIENLLYVYGNFIEVNNQFKPSLSVYQIPSLKSVRSPGPNKSIQVIKQDSQNVYVTGYFDKYGYPAGRGLVSNSLKLTNIANPPNIERSFNNPEISAIALDDKKGYFLGGDYDEIGDTAYRSLVYIDSNQNLITAPLDYVISHIYHLDLFNDTLLIVGVSSETTQFVHYFNTKTWKQIATPFTCSRTNYPDNSIYKPYGKHHFILSEIDTINGISISGNVLINKSTGDWQWLPRSKNYDLVGGVMYFTNNNKPAAYQSGPITCFQPGDSVPRIISRMTGSIQTIIPDGKNGFYVAGDVRKNSRYEKIVHILPDGSEDKAFDIPMSESATVKDLKLIGDTLFVAGDFSSQWTSSTGSLFLIDVSTNTVISNSIKVKGEIRELSVKGDTLFLAGEFTSINGNAVYNKLAAINIKTMKVLSWTPKINGPVTSLTVHNNFVYAVGDFDSCSGKQVDYVCRFKSNNLNLDTGFSLQFDLIYPTSKPTFEVIKAYKDKLYIGGKTNKAKTNGKDLQSLIQYDLATDSVSDLGLELNHYYTIYDIDLKNDTLYLAGTFQWVKGRESAHFTAVSLKDTGVVYYLPKPSAAARCISLTNNKIWLGGDFTELGNYAGDYLKFNITTKNFSPSPNYGISGGQVSRVKDHVFLTGNASKTIDGFLHKRIYKYSLKNDSLIKWNAAFTVDNSTFYCHHMINFKDTLCLVVEGYNPVTPKGPTVNMVTLITVTADSGKIFNETTFDQRINGLNARDGHLYVTGEFTFLNYLPTKMTKLDNPTQRLDYGFQSDIRFTHLEIGKNYLWGVNKDLYKINKQTGKDFVVVRPINSNNGITGLMNVNGLMFVLGNYDSLWSIRYNPYSNKKIYHSDALVFNPLTESIGKTNLTFDFWPYLTKQGSQYYANPAPRWSVGPLAHIEQSALIKFNVKTGQYVSLNMSNSGSSQSFTRIYKDRLFIANNYYYYNNSTLKGILEYDLVSNKFIRELPGTGLCKNMVVSEDFVITSDDYGIKIFNLKTNQLISNLPNFNGKINTIYMADSVLYVGGDFSKVDGNNMRGIARINLVNFQIVPFKTPFPKSCRVTHFSGKGNYLFISGYNVEPLSSNPAMFTIFDMEYESLYMKRPVSTFDLVYTSQLINNVLFITGMDYGNTSFPYDLFTKVYNFNTGLEMHDLDDLNIKAENFVLHNGSLWVYGSLHNPTRWTDNFISKIDGELFNRSVHIDHFNPVNIGRGKDARMTITGYGFTNNTKFWLQNGSDTIRPIDSTLSHDSHGLLISGLYMNIQKPIGLYDLVLRVPGDTTLIIENAVEIDTSMYGKMEISIYGRDTIRSNTWSSYTIEIKNSANFDYYNVPVFIAISEASEIKVREPVRSGDSIFFDSKNFVIDIDSIGNQTFDGKLVSLLLPEVPANGERLISLSFKSTNTTTKSEIVGWFHSPITGVDSQLSVKNAYSNLLRISNPCSDSAINKLEANRALVNKFNSGRRPELRDYLNWLQQTSSGCGSSFNPDSVIDLLTPPLSGAAYAHSSNGNSMEAYNGETSFIDSIQIRKQIRIVNSLDPNIKIGYKGLGNNNYAQNIPGQLFYAIHFENDSSASAPVQKLVIIDSLDKASFDVESVTFSEIALGDRMVQFDRFSQSIDDVFELDGDDRYLVHIKISVDAQSGVLTCIVSALDRLTLTAENMHPLDGFLPPNRDGKNGNGYLSFFVKKRSGASIIKNNASIIFDNNKAIETPTWTISRDSIPPVSSITALNASEKDATIEVNWGGSDNGCGLEHYTVYYSDNDINYSPLIERTTTTQFVFTGENEKSYYFYSIATDSVGNVEQKAGYDQMVFIGTNSISTLNSSWAKVYPNPSNGEFRIDVTSKGNYTLVIYTVLGRQILTEEFSNGFNGSLPSGIYLISLTRDDGVTYNSKLVIR